jgi:multiple sugar transport system permease protein
MKGIRKPEKIITHCVLIAGALIFAYPFLWMLGTSAKVKREMAAENLRLFPRAPHPQRATPYIDIYEFEAPKQPDGIPDRVWEAVRPKLEAQLTDVVDRWQPQTPGPDDNAPPGRVGRAAYRTEMVEGLMEVLGNRISDAARGKAVEVEEKLRTGSGGSSANPPRELAENLSDEAVAAGVDAILEDARHLVDEKTLRETFDSCYRRFCLGEVRVRTRDYQSHSLYTGSEWHAVEGSAELVERADAASKAQEARISFTPGSKTASFAFEPALRRVKAEDVDRVYVGYRGDASWASLTFEVARAGKLYRTTSWLNLYDRDWLEQELRWKEKRADPMAPRRYMLLHPAGDAPAGTPGFAVRVTVKKVGTLAAWIAKLTQNYRMTFAEVNYARYIMTSFALAILNIVLAVFSCTLVAYAFARLQWPGRDIWFGVLLATMMIPAQVTMIPSFLVARYLGWYNTLVPLWIYSAFGAAFFIFLLRQFFKNVPRDLEDAARIDGCGFLRVYWHVMMPLVKPTIATIAIYTFMGVWNNFMGPLIYVNDEYLFPLALGLFKFNLQSGADVGMMMAGSFVMTLPIILLFFFVQRYFIQGISLTGVKG